MDVFGYLPDGREVTRWRLHGGGGAYVDVVNYGGTVQSICVPDRDGALVDVALGYDDLDGYRTGTCFLGATVGRHANRIGGGWFTLNGQVYELAKNSGPNHLHGGPEGFDRRLFDGEMTAEGLKLTLLSPDMDQGYPGAVRVEVTVAFSEDNALAFRYRAVADRDTVVNLTNHTYFDLSGGADPMGQTLEIDADYFCENDENTLPTGTLLPVDGTAFDFRREKEVGRDLRNPEPQLLRCGGYDHNFVLKNGGKLQAVARMRSAETGIAMTVETDLPGMQLYSANFLEGRGKGGRAYGKNGAVCLETQFFPNALAIPAFAQPVLRAGEVYAHETVYRFDTL